MLQASLAGRLLLRLAEGNQVTTDNQFLRLPKHAQETIRTLRRELDKAQRRIEELEEELTPIPGVDATGRVSYEASLVESSGRRPMPDRSYFHFRLDHGELRLMMQQSRDGSKRWIDINADQSVAVRPTATNSIRIFTESRFES